MPPLQRPPAEVLLDLQAKGFGVHPQASHITLHHGQTTAHVVIAKFQNGWGLAGVLCGGLSGTTLDLIVELIHSLDAHGTLISVSEGAVYTAVGSPSSVVTITSP